MSTTFEFEGNASKVVAEIRKINKALKDTEDQAKKSKTGMGGLAGATSSFVGNAVKIGAVVVALNKLGGVIADAGMEAKNLGDFFTLAGKKLVEGLVTKIPLIGQAVSKLKEANAEYEELVKKSKEEGKAYAAQKTATINEQKASLDEILLRTGRSKDGLFDADGDLDFGGNLAGVDMKKFIPAFAEMASGSKMSNQQLIENYKAITEQYAGDFGSEIAVAAGKGGFDAKGISDFINKRGALLGETPEQALKMAAQIPEIMSKGVSRQDALGLAVSAENMDAIEEALKPAKPKKSAEQITLEEETLKQHILKLRNNELSENGEIKRGATREEKIEFKENKALIDKLTQTIEKLNLKMDIDARRKQQLGAE